MKRLIAIIIVLFSCQLARSESLEFSWSAGADVVSTYIWRGNYDGGLSFQPSCSIGWTSEHTSLDFGLWSSVGASDWGFRSGLPEYEGYNPNTYFIPEFDVFCTVNLWGATIGFTHLYFFDGESYFNFGDINEIEGTAQTEVSAGYDFSTLFPKVDLQLSWNTIVSGADCIVDGKRCFSTYIEASYTQHFKYDISLQGVVGFAPWRSIYTDPASENPQDFAFNNLTLRLDKTWPIGSAGELDLFLQGTMNTCNLNKDNAFIWASGDDKLYKQKIMGALGVSISF